MISRRNEMFSTKYLSKLAQSLLVVSTLGIIVAPAVVAQVPAQYPLLNTSGGGVPPNFMLTMDDSGSMAFKHMPETVFAGGTFVTPNPVGTNSVRWDPTDNYMYGVNPYGIVKGDKNSTNYVVRAMRSPDTNTIFYNPEILYQPWAVSTYPLPAATAGVPAGRMANSPPAAAYLDPVNPTTGGVINLTAYVAPAGSSNWCNFNASVAPLVVPAGSFIVGVRYQITVSSSNFTSIGAANNNVGTSFVATGVGTGSGVALPNRQCDSIANNHTSLNHDPGVYFRLNKQTYAATVLKQGTSYTITTVGSPATDFTKIGASNNLPGTIFTATGTNTGAGGGTVKGYSDLTVHTNYTAYNINAPTGTTFSKSANRTDCTGATCTQAQERQNFANWYTYYRNRNLLARGAMMESFANVGNTVRVGFGRINKNAGAVDGISTTVIESQSTGPLPPNRSYGGGGVRQFDQTRKTQLFNWLMDLPASGGTPLPAAMVAVGEYYKRTDAQGPYTDDPNVANDVTKNKSCRRSYNLMMTDGYWNGAVNVGDVDSAAIPTISGPGGASFSLPADTLPYADGVSGTLADIAMKYWSQDLQPDVGGVANSGMKNDVKATSSDPSFWQNMTNYMVGLGVKGSLDPETDLPALTLGGSGAPKWGVPSATNPVPANIDDLWHAALNSRGAYYSAKDPASLASAVSNALVGAQGGGGATAGVATVSSVLQNGNRKYIPGYDGNTWSGEVEALPLFQNGQAGSAVWKAASRIPLDAYPPSPAAPVRNRNVYTWDTAPTASPATPGGVPFIWSSLSSANQTAMSSGSENLVNFLRGDLRNEVGLTNPLGLYRARKDKFNANFVLGDIVNSNPVLVKGLFDGGYGGLNLGGTTATYQIFTAAKSARDGVLFVGANDGMLHAFKDVNAQPPLASTSATDGAEVFAYVPRAVYGNLSKLADKNYGGTVPHQFYVDGPQREHDAYVSGAAYPAFNGMPACAAGATCWRNFLVGSLGAGGKTVYALDVTSSPNLGASNISWELTDVDLGYVMAPIQIGVLPSGKWVAIFGNGYSSTSGTATLFVVDMQTKAVTKLDVDTSGNGLGGVGMVRDVNGVIQSLYAGDLKGKVWRFDYNNASVPFVVNGGGPFFTGSGPAQPITQPPAVFDHSQGGKIIVFGTGSLFTAADASSTTVQSIYGVWDKPADTIARPITPTPLLEQRALAVLSGTGKSSTTTFYTLTGNPVNWTTQRGWKVDVAPTLARGRIVYPPLVFTSKLVLVTAVAPAVAAVVCGSNDGEGADFVFNVEDGLQATYPITDTNGDGIVDSTDTLVGGVLTKSVGIRAVVSGISGNTGITAASGAGASICLAGYHPISIQTTTGQSLTCVPDDPVVGTNRPFDRVQRRIINPPIR
jgi:type IV pilus assembly protein PilY1